MPVEHCQTHSILLLLPISAQKSVEPISSQHSRLTLALPTTIQFQITFLSTSFVVRRSFGVNPVVVAPQVAQLTEFKQCCAVVLDGRPTVISFARRILLSLDVKRERGWCAELLALEKDLSIVAQICKVW